MKHVGITAAWLATGLLWQSSGRAADASLPGNPYTAIVARNVFGLNPAPVVDPNATQVEPPVKITPNGIMASYGQWQVLFKVAAKPGGKDAFYTLAVGQRQDDIEVTKIDNVKGMVTFNNHGVVQELALVAAPALTTTPAPVATPGLPGVASGVPPLPSNGAPGGRPAFNGTISGRTGIERNNSGNGGSMGSSFGTTPAQNNNSDSGPRLDAAEQTVAIEVQREYFKSIGDSTAQILPPTEITPGSDPGSDATPPTP